jgi:hypothetical protein
MEKRIEDKDISEDSPLHEENKLAQEMERWVEQCEKFWKPIFDELDELRERATGSYGSDDDEGLVRTNLYHSTLQSIIPYVYARNPDYSISPSDGVEEDEIQTIKSFSTGLGICLSRGLRDAKLKKHAKAAVRAAFTSRVSWLKLIYQKEYKEDPLIRNRIEDAQDNVARLQSLIAQIEDPLEKRDKEAVKEELINTIKSLERNVEVVVSEGLVIDRVRMEHILLDPTIDNMCEWQKSRRVVHIILMPKSEAETRFNIKFETITTYTWEQHHKRSEEYGRKQPTRTEDDPIVKIYEIWDRKTMMVYTIAEGHKGFIRPAYALDRQPEQWFPFFQLALFVVDGKLVPISMIELLQELVDEYNKSRTQQAEHRELSIPHWIADKTTDRNSLERYRDAVLGDITLVDAQGRPLNEVIVSASPPPFNPALYDTSSILRDVDMVSGSTDAQRGTVARNKTLGEAEIMQQGVASRASEVQDSIEDWMQEIGIAAAEMLLMEYEPNQVMRIAGKEAASNWPTLEKRDIFNMVDIDIRAGTTGKPNKQQEQESWSTLYPELDRLQDVIMQIEAQTQQPAEHKRELLKETARRLDERIDVDLFLPPKPQQAMGGLQNAMQGLGGMDQGMEGGDILSNLMGEGTV